MFIRAVDEGLVRMLRAEVPLAPEEADISFAPPRAGWDAALPRTTVNLFLYEVTPSVRPAQSLNRRVDPRGDVQRRRTLPMVDLNYLVSVWAADPLEEHRLLSEVVNRIAGQVMLSPEYLPAETDSSVLTFLGGDEKSRPLDIWRALGGEPRASFTLSIAVAADSFGWVTEAPPVTQVLRNIDRRAE